MQIVEQRFMKSYVDKMSLLLLSQCQAVKWFTLLGF
jgi:hypothetical protein